ncbi:hypothetical protein JHJ32_07625 [Parapedobacter sp. ISTM3]|uniref:hypothetical protein n=1 Tax=Parapedobacter sp. ISTM3 TaxID=2800130 RepID=UPI0019036A3F|nr:hypothetical protein [Parapedobacter sp. ISTM3]MBK1439848.1 hypothetical protein [Parapedobacter sp. ISTM3]
MKKIFTLLSALGILYSCSKETEVVKYPYQLTFDAIEPVSEMRFFIGETELDPKYHEETLQGFLDRLYSEKTNTGYRYYQSKFTEQDPDWFADSYFTFDGKDIIQFSALSEISNINQVGETTVLKSSATNKVTDDPIVKSDLFKYDIDINSNGTYNIQFIVRNQEHALEVSRLYYKLVRYDENGNRKQLSFGTISNEFNESFIKTLTERDTLAIKEYRLKYSMKQ